MSTEKEQQKIPFFARLQVKYAMSYLAILALVLVLLNTYPLLAAQDLLVSSKKDSLRSQAAVMSSALMELESLSADQVARVRESRCSVMRVRRSASSPMSETKSRRVSRSISSL